tara:strand:+ start:206 stop:973 length:768 start_codon:yes stop_codon:yes gene_type:complete
MIIVIPSYNRVNILKERTLSLLERHNINKKSINIFVVREEYAKYKNGLHDDYNIIIGKKGIAEQRGFISDYFQEDEALVSMDDDIKEILELHEKNDKKYIKPCIDLSLLINKTFDEMRQQNVRMCGFYPVKNAFFMSPTTSLDLKFCIGQFRLFFNYKEIEMNRQYKLLEDYETTLKYYLYDDSKIMRKNYICMDADYNKLKGGLNDVADRRYIVKKKEVEQFYYDFNVYCFVKNRPPNKIDIGFKRKANGLSIW